MKVVFFGTPSFSAHVLKFLLEHDIDIVAVVSKPDRPQGRSKTPVPTEVKQATISWKKEIPIFQPEKISTTECAAALANFQPDLFVVVAYGEIIKESILKIPKKGCINLHTSLLPKYRGAAPIQHAIMHGETKTGVSIIHMTKKMDAGDVIKMVEVPIGPNDLFFKIEDEICKVGSQALLEVIHAFEKGSITEKKQDESKVTFAPKIELEDCEIHWDKPAQEIHNLIRAVSPEPAAWCSVFVKEQKKRLKIYESRVMDTQGKVGEILSYAKDGFVIGCGEGSLRIMQLQLEGKKVMSADEFMRGHSKDQLRLT